MKRKIIKGNHLLCFLPSLIIFSLVTGCGTELMPTELEQPETLPSDVISTKTASLEVSPTEVVSTETVQPVFVNEELNFNCNRVVLGIYSLILDLDIPDNLNAWGSEEVVRDGSEFDVNRYFEVLDHLQLESGYVLDYVYFANMGNGSPVLYAREESSSRFRSFLEYKKSFNEPIKSADDMMIFFTYLAEIMEEEPLEDFSIPEEYYKTLYYGYTSQVITDGTEDGYFQFVLLRVIGSQFYLQWHSNYQDKVVICGQVGLEEVLSNLDWWITGIPEEGFLDEIRGVLEQARVVELNPTVEIKDDVVVVSFAYFRKWGGVKRMTITISKEPPHEIISMETETMIEYQIGIVY